MTNKNGALAVRKEDVTLVTWRDLGPLEKTLKECDGLSAQVSGMEVDVRSMKVIDKPSFDRAAARMLTLKEIRKQRDALIDPRTQVLERMKKLIWDKTDTLYTLAEELEKILNKTMAEWADLEEKRAEAERIRVAQEKQAQLEREAVVQRMKDEKLANELKRNKVAAINADRKAKKITAAQAAKLLREAGADAEAAIEEAEAREEEAKENAADIASRVVVESKVGTTSGLVNRVRYKYTVKYPQKVKLIYLTPDHAKINPLVMACKTEEDAKRVMKEVGGIEIVPERKF